MKLAELPAETWPLEFHDGAWWFMQWDGALWSVDARGKVAGVLAAREGRRIFGIGPAGVLASRGDALVSIDLTTSREQVLDESVGNLRNATWLADGAISVRTLENKCVVRHHRGSQLTELAQDIDDLPFQFLANAGHIAWFALTTHTTTERPKPNDEMGRIFLELGAAFGEALGTPVNYVTKREARVCTYAPGGPVEILAAEPDDCIVALDTRGPWIARSRYPNSWWIHSAVAPSTPVVLPDHYRPGGNAILVDGEHVIATTSPWQQGDHHEPGRIVSTSLGSPSSLSELFQYPNGQVQRMIVRGGVLLVSVLHAASFRHAAPGRTDVLAIPLT